MISIPPRSLSLSLPPWPSSLCLSHRLSPTLTSALSEQFIQAEQWLTDIMQTLEPAAFISCLPLIVLCVSFLSLLSSCFSLVSPVCNLFSVSFLLLVFSWCRLSPAPPSASWRLLSFVGRFSPNFVLSALNFGTSPTENFQSCFISSSFLQVFFSHFVFWRSFLETSCLVLPNISSFATRGSNMNIMLCWKKAWN